MTEQQLIDEGYKEGVKSFDFLIKQIMEHFRFDRVYATMKLLDWGWAVLGSNTNETYIPTIDALKKKVYDSCKRVYDGERQFSTGGFSYHYADNALSVSFTIEDWCAE